MSAIQAAQLADSSLYVPRKVVILAADPMLPDGSFEEFKHGMYLGGQTRMEAAAHLAKVRPETEFIIVGGYNRPGEGAPKVSDKVNSMAAFMRTHVPDAKLELVPSLPCTRHNFIALYHHLRTAGQSPTQVGILSSQWHLERALVFGRQAQTLFRLDHPIELISLPAEKILGTSPQRVVGDRLAEYESRTAAEKRGLQQIADGSYTDSCLANSMPLVEQVSLALI